jgi:hypothetical protein
MSYIQSLLQSRELADKIRSGEYKAATKQPQQEATQGLVRRPTVEAEPAVASEQDSMQELLASYLAGIRQKQEAEVDSGGFETRTVEDVGATRPVSRRDAGFEPVPGTLNDLSAAREAIAAVESRGSGDYAAIGPVVNKGMYKGQRAYGRYQVMEGNIGPWTKEVFGKPMTTEEFMNNPEAQDAVVEHQLRKSYEKFGTYDDAASVWFSGQPYDPSSRKSDGSTTVPEYVKKFRRFFVENKGTS